MEAGIIESANSVETVHRHAGEFQIGGKQVREQFQAAMVLRWKASDYSQLAIGEANS